MKVLSIKSIMYRLLIEGKCKCVIKKKEDSRTIYDLIISLDVKNDLDTDVSF